MPAMAILSLRIYRCRKSDDVFVNVNVKVNVIVIVILILIRELGCSVYISLDVGRLYVAYPHMGAMRRPEHEDRRGEKLTPTSFFVSISFSCL